ncbi:restriction endonuclease [Anaerosalibacter sp. Marseille-P3206]|uniref:restriction endonuclease n=1 Tax=Anaerosalibacter sp. Marseille-P3206 TaxID=1871005 RepID=UPI00098592E9|nr:restriction endonuclease [Anaerosalibacter sp. Marseille-P3206]
MGLFEYLYTDNYNNFEEWLDLIKNREIVYPRFRIPYQEWVDSYIRNITNIEEKEVKVILRLLLQPFTRTMDIVYYKTKINLLRNYGEILEDDHKKVYQDVLEAEQNKRIENGDEAWEGLTWVLQYLPYKPYKAIRALKSYLEAEVCLLPDDRILGIDQCIQIIEAKYIKNSNGLEKYILNLKPREFEWLIGSLYEDLGYSTELTPETKDGGKDIIASINRTDGSEKVYIECKLYKTTKLTKETVRAFGYSIVDDKINRGVLFCTGYVSENIKLMDPRIQIWILEEIIILLNAHMGSDWYKRLNILIQNQRRKYEISI